jgi:hypothetical protein
VNNIGEKMWRVREGVVGEEGIGASRREGSERRAFSAAGGQALDTSV